MRGWRGPSGVDLGDTAAGEVHDVVPVLLDTRVQVTDASVGPVESDGGPRRAALLPSHTCPKPYLTISPTITLTLIPTLTLTLTLTLP